MDSVLEQYTMQLKQAKFSQSDTEEDGADWKFLCKEKGIVEGIQIQSKF